MGLELGLETLFLTISITDRYLACTPVQEDALKFVGSVAMFIASKFEEVHPLEVGQFASTIRRTKEDIMALECCILMALDFELAVPTPLQFFEQLQQLNQCNAFHREFALFILKTAVVNLQWGGHKPSQVAAAALLVSNDMFGRKEVWPQALVDQLQCEEFVLGPCVQEIRAVLAAAQNASTLEEQH